MKTQTNKDTPIRKSGLCLLDSNGMPSQTLLTWEDGLDRLESQFKKN